MNEAEWAEILKEDGKAIRDAMITEAVYHFIGCRSREFEDEARYLIGEKELKDFIAKYKEVMIKYESKGKTYTKPKELRVGVVKELSYKGKYYEICRKSVFRSNPELFYGD